MTRNPRLLQTPINIILLCGCVYNNMNESKVTCSRVGLIHGGFARDCIKQFKTVVVALRP